MTRVVLVANTDWYLYNHRLSLAEALRRLGREVHLVSPDGPYAVRLQQAGFAWHAVALDRKGTNLLHEVRTWRRLADLYAALQPALVHHFTVKPVIYGSLAARQRSIPALVNSITGRGYVFSGRGLRPGLLRLVVRPLVSYALGAPNQRVIFQHQGDLDAYLAMGLVQADRSAVIPGSGIDPERFSPQPEPAGDAVVLMPSRMLWDKGVEDLVEASRRLRRAGLRFRTVLAGSPDPGNPTSISEQQLRAWAAEGSVEWIGQQEDMVSVYAGAHIVVLPSHAEGVPRALIEAAAMGKPIVATDLPGCRKVVTPGLNGLLVPSRDVEALSQALRVLIEHPARRADMGVESRTIALRSFTDDIVNGQIIDVYDSLLRAVGQPTLQGG